MPKRKIVEIRPQVRNPQRSTIIFDDGSVFGISEDVFISHRFKVGDEIDDIRFDKIFLDELRSKVFNSAVRLLSFRMRSVHELRGRLKEKKYPDDLIEDVLSKLINMKYLNDKEFAVAFANDKVNNKKIGPIALRKEFIPHKLEHETIEAAIEKVYKKYPVKELIMNHLTKKNILRGSELDQKVKKRSIDLLTRKGFTWHDISAVFNELEIRI